MILLAVVITRMAQTIVGCLIRSRQRAHHSGRPSMSLGARRLDSVRCQFLIGEATKTAKAVLARNSHRNCAFLWCGDSKSFDLVFDFIREVGSAGAVYDPMIKGKREGNYFSALIFITIWN